MNQIRITCRALAVAVAAAIGTPVIAATANPGVEKATENPGVEASAAEFRKLDVNGDGYLGLDEASKIAGFDKAFREADGNRDGRLDTDEFVKAQAVHERVRAGRFVEDSVITARVKAALLKDASVSGLAVSVETYHGTVLLSGFVQRESQAQRAEEIAAGVPGVVNVKSNLTVKS